jgi:hypothetical protein
MPAGGTEGEPLLLPRFGDRMADRQWRVTETQAWLGQSAVALKVDSSASESLPPVPLRADPWTAGNRKIGNF